NFMRVSAQFANPAQPPSPELIAGLFPLIQGVEIKGVTAPFKNTGKFVNLDGFDLNWGRFVGPIPSKARLTAKMTTPVDATDPASVDGGVVHHARAQNVSRDAARKAIVESIRAGSQDTAAANPDATDAVQALARFVESPGQTLVIKLTPLGKLQAMQLFQLLKTDPMIALAQFRIEASTGL